MTSLPHRLTSRYMGLYETIADPGSTHGRCHRIARSAPPFRGHIERDIPEREDDIGRRLNTGHGLEPPMAGAGDLDQGCAARKSGSGGDLRVQASVNPAPFIGIRSAHPRAHVLSTPAGRPGQNRA
jgi:hypothetical protein